MAATTAEQYGNGFALYPKYSGSALEHPGLSIHRSNSNPWDIHVYWRDEAGKREALELQRKLYERFQPVGFEFFGCYDYPIGPHALPMLSVHFGSWYSHQQNKEALLNVFGEVNEFLAQHHGTLSILLHPNTMSGNTIDHTDNAIWFGEQLPIKKSIFSD